MDGYITYVSAKHKRYALLLAYEFPFGWTIVSGYRTSIAEDRAMASFRTAVELLTLLLCFAFDKNENAIRITNHNTNETVQLKRNWKATFTDEYQL